MATSIIEQKKKGVETFTLTLASGISTGEGYGIYDKTSGIVRINFWYNNGNTAIPATDTLFTVPQDYRPSENKLGSGMYWVPTNSLCAGAQARVNANGTVVQSGSGAKTRGFGYIEYAI